MRPKVTVVIVNWNGKIYLDRCLTSVAAQTYDNYNVILIDNASTDGSAEFVREQYPQVKIITLDRNYEFAKANNIGIRMAIQEGAQFIALLNNDTKVEGEWLSELVKAMYRDPGVGICASKMLRMDDPRIIDSTGHYFVDGIIRDRGNGELDIGQYDSKAKVVGGCAGASLYRKTMFDAIGLFDESYGFYYEDAELSWRAYNSGWKAVFVPTSVVYHVRGGTARGDATLQEELRRRDVINIVRTVKRHASLKQRIVLSLIWMKEAMRQWVEAVMQKKKIKSEYMEKLALLWFKRI